MKKCTFEPGFIAKDSNDKVFYFRAQPVLVGYCWRVAPGTPFTQINQSIRFANLGDYKTSLCAIAADGTLTKVATRPDFEIDDKILVRDHDDDEWLPRHFAGWKEDGRARTFYKGATSFTHPADRRTGAWKQFKAVD